MINSKLDLEKNKDENVHRYARDSERWTKTSIDTSETEKERERWTKKRERGVINGVTKRYFIIDQ